MNDAAGFERTIWLGKEPVLIALVAASAGFASLSAADLLASAESPRQLGSLQSAIPVPAFGAAPTEVPAPNEVLSTDSEQASHAGLDPTVQTAPVDEPTAESAPVQIAPVETAPAAASARAAEAPELPQPDPEGESVDVAFAEFRMPDSSAVALAEPNPAPVAQSVAAPVAPSPEITVAQAPVAAEAPPAPAINLANQAAQALASAPPAFDGPPVILTSFAAEAPVLPAPMQSVPELTPQATLLAALTSGPDESRVPHDASSLAVEVLAESEPAAPAQSLAAAPGTLDAAAPNASALAEWSRSVRQVGGWSLAQASDAPAVHPVSPAPQAGSAKPATFRDAPVAARKHRLTGRGIEFALPVVLEGRGPAWVPLLIDAEQNISVRIGDLLALVEPMLPPDSFTRLSASQGAQEFVSLRSLRAQGIDFRYDAARNRLVLGDIAAAADAPRMAMLRDQ